MGGTQSKELRILSKGPVGIREALGVIVGVFLQSLLYISPELKRGSKQVGGALAKPLGSQQAHKAIPQEAIPQELTLPHQPRTVGPI